MWKKLLFFSTISSRFTFRGTSQDCRFCCPIKTATAPPSFIGGNCFLVNHALTVGIFPPASVYIHSLVERILSDGRSYLCGESISAADIAFASLAFPVLLPDQTAEIFVSYDPGSLPRGYVEIIKRYDLTTPPIGIKTMLKKLVTVLQLPTFFLGS